MRLRSFYIAIILFWACNISAYTQDAIIFRDGRVKYVKIIQTNNDKTIFKESDNKKASEEYVENTKVFMLKFKTRGNVVFNGNGERILTTSEHVQIPKDAIVVYYKDGREVPAYNLTMDANTVSFKTTKKAKDRPIFSPKSEVFMIRYPDGTKATIVTKKGVRMKVWVCSDTPTMVSYKKVNSAKAAIFNMSKAKIKNIIY